jgi:nitrite reductase (NADH) small subunit
MVWTKLGRRDSVAVGSGKEFTVNGVSVAVFNVDGKFFATEARCRHQDGPLAEGKLKGEIIECPWHFWNYNVRSGKLLDYLKDVKLNTYAVEIKGNDLYIDV